MTRSGQSEEVEKDQPSDQAENPADRGEPTKPAGVILSQEMGEATVQFRRPPVRLLMSSFSAGFDIGLGPLLIAFAWSWLDTSSIGGHLLVAAFYSIGFLVVILGRSELFTEHTTRAILPVIDRRETVRSLARLWGLVYLGNVAGTVVFALGATPLGLGLGLFAREGLAAMVSRHLGISALLLFGSAIGAGWIMGLVSWLVTASRETTAQILLIVVLTGTISFLGFNHAIAGSAELLMGLVASQLGPLQWVRFLLITTVGNAIGGAGLVAILKYGHAREIGAEG